MAQYLVDVYLEGPDGTSAPTAVNTTQNITVNDTVRVRVFPYQSTRTWSVHTFSGATTATGSGNSALTSGASSFVSGFTAGVSYSITVQSTTPTGTAYGTVSGTVSAVTVTAPVVSSSQGGLNSTTALASIQAPVALSSQGSPTGGTTAYTIFTSGTAYNTTNSFTVTRGTSYYFGARYTYSGTHYYATNVGPILFPYLAPSATGSLNSASYAYTGGTTSHTFGGYTPPGHASRVILPNGTALAAGVYTVTVPAAAGTYTYYIQTQRTVAAGGNGSTWSASHGVATITRVDTTPNQFSFNNVTEVATGSSQFSNTITVGGINAATNVTISGGTYSKNGGSYTSAATTAVVNDTFRVNHTASSFNNTAVNTTLTIGGVSATFTSTTVAVIVAPVVNDSQSFTNHTNGVINSYLRILISLSSQGSGGTLEYATSTDPSATTSTFGIWSTQQEQSVTRGDTLYVYAKRSSTAFDRSAGSFTVPYVAPTLTGFALSNITGVSNTATSVNTGNFIGTMYTDHSTAIRAYPGGVSNLGTTGTSGTSIDITAGLPASGGNANYELFVRRIETGGGSGVFTATGVVFNIARVALPTTPTGITFTNGTDLSQSTTVVATAAPVISGTTLQIFDGSSWQSSPHTFSVQRNVSVDYYARRIVGTDSSPTLSVAHTVPFLFSADKSVTIASTTTELLNSNTDDVEVTLTGIDTNDQERSQYRLVNTTNSRWVATYNSGASQANGAFTIYKSDPSDQVDELPPSNTAWTYKVQVRHIGTKGGDDEGSVDYTFIATDPEAQITITRSTGDTTPEPFNLEASAGLPVIDASQNSDYTSDTITVGGLTAGVTVTIQVSGTGTPTYSKNSGAYTATTGTVENGDTVTLKVRSASSANTQVTGTLNIGGVTDTFSVTTAVAGGSGSGLTSPVTNTYGLELRNAGGSLVLQPKKRLTNYQGSGSLTASTVENGDTVSGWVNSPDVTDPTKVLVSLDAGQSNPNRAYIDTRTDSGGQFRLLNPGTTTTITLSYTVVRYG